MAARAGHTDVAKYLLQNKAKANAKAKVGAEDNLYDNQLWEQLVLGFFAVPRTVPNTGSRAGTPLASQEGTGLSRLLGRMKV